MLYISGIIWRPDIKPDQALLLTKHRVKHAMDQLGTN